MTRVHGVALEYACEVVGLPRERFIASDRDAGYVPLPGEIIAMTQAIQTGEIIVSRASKTRWAKYFDAMAVIEEIEATDAYTLEDLASEDDGREVQLPPWLYSAKLSTG